MNEIPNRALARALFPQVSLEGVKKKANTVPLKGRQINHQMEDLCRSLAALGLMEAVEPARLAEALLPGRDQEKNRSKKYDGVLSYNVLNVRASQAIVDAVFPGADEIRERIKRDFVVRKSCHCLIFPNLNCFLFAVQALRQ